MKCPKCGIVIPDKDRVCEMCGADLHPERTLQSDNPYHQFKRQQAAKMKQEERERETRMLDERREATKIPPLRRSQTKAIPRRGRPPQRTTRRAQTKQLPGRSVGAAIAEATTTRGFLPSGRRLLGAVLCGVLVIFLATTYTWNYAVGYPSLHQLVLDFDGAVRTGAFDKARALSSGTLSGGLMEAISRASVSETYPFHVQRPDDSTRKIVYEEFTIDLRRSLGKWTLSITKNEAKPRTF